MLLLLTFHLVQAKTVIDIMYQHQGVLLRQVFGHLYTLHQLSHKFDHCLHRHIRLEQTTILTDYVGCNATIIRRLTSTSVRSD
jgi:hypothetical protein